jgi:hypothetical protein
MMVPDPVLPVEVDSEDEVVSIRGSKFPSSAKLLPHSRSQISPAPLAEIWGDDAASENNISVIDEDELQEQSDDENTQLEIDGEEFQKQSDDENTQLEIDEDENEEADFNFYDSDSGSSVAPPAATAISLPATEENYVYVIRLQSLCLIEPFDFFPSNFLLKCSISFALNAKCES